MRVVVVGASGVLGARVVASLVRAGHAVEGVVFHRESAAVVERLGGSAHVCNAAQFGTLHKVLQRADCVVQTLSSVNIDEAREQFVVDVQRQAVAHVARTVRDVQVRALVTTTLLPSHPEGFFTETTPLVSAASPALEGEEAAVAHLSESTVTRHVVLRLGQMYSMDCPWTQLIALGLQEKRVPVFGDNHLSFIHADDATSAIVCVVEDMLNNSYPVTPVANNKRFHIVDNVAGGVKQGDFLKRFAAAIGAPEPKSTMAFLAQMRLERGVMTLLSKNQQTANTLFCKNYPEWKIKYPSISEGLMQCAMWWKRLEPTKALVKT